MADQQEDTRGAHQHSASWNEGDRLAALDRYAILDTPREAEFDDVVRLAADVFGAPIAVVNLIASGRQWFKAEVGIGADELPLDVSICAHAILQQGIFVVPDTTADARFTCNPLVTGEPGLRFYAGALLETPDGLPLGTVCVLDTKPRPDGITERQRLTLELLARQVMTQLELRREIAQRDKRAALLQSEIDARRNLEASLRTSEQRYRALFDTIDAGFCIIEVLFDGERPVDYRFLEVNRAFEAQTGLVDAAGKRMRELAPDHEQHWFDIYGRVALSGEPIRFENEAAALGFWYDVRAFRIGAADERHVAVLFTDISERRRAERAIQQLNETLEAQVEARTAELSLMWQTSPDLMLEIDFDGVFRRVNPAWTKLLGFSESELVGHHVNEFVLPEHHDDTVDAYETAAEGQHAQVENRYRHKDGSVRSIAWVAAPAGSITYAIGRDITKEVEQRERLQQMEDQLRQAQKMEAVGQLTGGIAHDFNNMLAVTIGSLDLLKRRIGAEDARAVRYIDAAADGARRAANLTQRLLAFSRQQPLRPEPVNANSLVAGMSDLIRHSIGGDIQLETVLAGGLWRTHVDPNQLENVILNLAINARDAMADGGRITIETQNAHLDQRYVAAHLGVAAGQYVLIAVSDTGSGMTPEVIAKAFDPFFTTKAVGKGTGLGLSQAYGFVKQSGGHVKIYSEPGEGTTIKVYLPRLLGDHPEHEPESLVQPLPLGEEQELILVVEDEPAVRQFSVDALVELGYRVISAGSATEALRLLDANPAVSLLFTDVVMPEINGAKLAEEVMRRRPELPILFTTGYTRNAVVHNGVLEPGVQLIGKPFTIEELAARIREALDTATS
ncbi:PAS domain S-box protein [Sphingomonas sp. CCH5-D11]|uniref:PAS domain S-box protein n=1 Tax=Sphingomonas sp. CCH5-D11 TaxID=1768786 RepID=UPI000A82A215|nr:PAS domain S-box protein [Sphingomonas sp. CCH5-D11]